MTPAEKQILAMLDKTRGPRKSKYSSVITTVDGIKFRSKAEANRYSQLKLLEKAGDIRGLHLQPIFHIIVGEVQVGRYVADFQYFDQHKRKSIVEDVKGHKTALYNFKKKCVEAQYGITITEIRP